MSKVILLACCAILGIQVLADNFNEIYSPKVSAFRDRTTVMTKKLDYELQVIINRKRYSVTVATSTCNLKVQSLRTSLKPVNSTICGKIAQLQLDRVVKELNSLSYCRSDTQSKQIYEQFQRHADNLYGGMFFCQRMCLIQNKTGDTCVDKTLNAIANSHYDLEKNVMTGIDLIHTTGWRCVQNLGNLQRQVDMIKWDLNACLNKRPGSKMLVAFATPSVLKESNEESPVVGAQSVNIVEDNVSSENNQNEYPYYKFSKITDGSNVLLDEKN